MRRSPIAVLILLGLSVTAVTAAPVTVPARYTVEVPPDLDALQVRACFEASGRFDLRASSPQAGRLLAAVTGGNDARATVRGGRIEASVMAADGCIAYRLDLGAATQRGHWRRDFVVATDAILISPGLFLWLPDGIPDVVVEFRLPSGYRVSAPWEALASTEQGAVFRTGAGSARRDGKVALGRFETYRLDGAAAAVEVALLEGVPAVDKALIRQWLNANVEAVTAIFGRFPVPRLQLLVVPIGRGGEPVPWGQVSRNGGDAVHLYIDQHMPARDFMGDWVLSHELSHLLHPYLNGGARWVYEGLASYYQNVSRARTGMMSPREAWQELHAGFERGRRGTKPGRTLEDATESMRAQRAYMQVYWSGAAIFLLADLELRQTSAQRQSLDSVLDAFADCCLRAHRVWTEHDFFEQLDHLSDSDVFTRLADLYRNSDRFPDLSAAYARLGLKPHPGHGLAFSDHPEQVAMRAAIMGGP